MGDDGQEAVTGTGRPGRAKDDRLPQYVMDSLYRVRYQLNKDACERLGLTLKIPVFIKDPLIALEDPVLGVQEISVRLEQGMGNGPTSSRVVVVDFNSDSQALTGPTIWDEKEAWFRNPLTNAWLPDAPKVPKDSHKVKNLEKYRNEYKQFIEKTVCDPFFHQLNAWAVVQRVLEFYEDAFALGRPVPWGFDGNRLIVVPHVGYGENAFYDQKSKSLQFYYFGDQEKPSYTCLSHDIISHETGHAILDGIRPMYNELSSVQTAAFHEFIGDLTAILLALFNEDIRRFVSKTTEGRLGEANILANIAKEFGEEVEGRDYLRTAFNKKTLLDKEIKDSLSPHLVSEVMTGAMWDILVTIATKHMEKNQTGKIDVADSAEDKETASEGDGNSPTATTARVSPARALWWAADRFRRIALQPLDLCPPCDIQFIDYAKAVILNDILTNPVDVQGYRPAMLKVFHDRGLCTCGYKIGENLPRECKFMDAARPERMEFVTHNINRLSSSRTAAYYFLSDNREVLRIPAHQDVRVVDLYDNSKLGAAAERLPREIVLEYAWQEVVRLANDRLKELDFGAWDGKTFNLTCGGTLVFDDDGNLLSWFRKPGTEHITRARFTDIQQRYTNWKNNQGKKPTKQELAEMEDYETGQGRKAAVKKYLAQMIQRGLVGTQGTENRFNDGLKPVTITEQNGIVYFETTPHLRETDFDAMEDGWAVNY